MNTLMKIPRSYLYILSTLTLFLSGIHNGAFDFVPVTHAAEQAAQQNWMFHKKAIVDEAFIKQYAVIPKRDDVMIIDSRPTARKYDKGHIPTARSIPDREFMKRIHLLPSDKKTLLIMYCGGTKCKKSHKSAYMAEELGYTNVKVYSKGYPDWIKKGNLSAVSTAYVKNAIDTNKNVVIIDTRPKRKYDKGHVTTAINIPDRQFDQMLDTLPTDKNTSLIFYCGGYKCTKSVTTAKKAIDLGYTNVKTFPAGYPAWNKAYGNVNIKPAASTGGKPTTAKLVAGAEEGTVTVESFQKAMKENRDGILLIDVRSPTEHATATISGAVNIPIDDLDKKIDELPTDKPIVFFCNMGGTSGEAYDMLKEFRPELEAYFLSAELTCDKQGNYTVVPIE